MKKKQLKYIIHIMLVLVVMLALVACKKDEKKIEESDMEGGLQVEESGDGDSISLDELFSEQDDKKDTDKDGVVDKKDDDDDNDGVKDDKDDDDDNDGTPDVKDPDHPTNSDSGKENNKEENKDNENDKVDHGYGPLF